MLALNALHSVTAFAPATCANVAVGFDLLGFPIASVGDEVTLTRAQSGVNLVEIDSAHPLPSDPTKNVASSVILKVCEDYGLAAGFDISIKKGIPVGSGMGGSAASSVAALTALNAFLVKPLSLATLTAYAVYGEKIATGHVHPDNVVPCLYGGLTLINQVSPLSVIHLPIPAVYCVLVNPLLRLDTREARAVLPHSLALTAYVKQARNLAGFIASLYEKDLTLLKCSLNDSLIEPHRASLVKGFSRVKEAALKAGALGASLSGSGPSVFAFAQDKAIGQAIAEAMVDAFSSVQVKAKAWVSPISNIGANVVAKD